MRCVNENRKKRKRLRWQAANHGCHCFDRAFLLAGACVCCVNLPTQALVFLTVFVYATHATQTIAFEWKPLQVVFCCLIQNHSAYIEIAELLSDKDPLGAVDVYSRFPTAAVPTFDDAYIFGEIVRILFKLQACDDPRMLSNMIAMGKVMGLGMITVSLCVLLAEHVSGVGPKNVEREWSGAVTICSNQQLTDCL